MVFGGVSVNDKITSADFQHEHKKFANETAENRLEIVTLDPDGRPVRNCTDPIANFPRLVFGTAAARLPNREYAYVDQ